MKPEIENPQLAPDRGGAFSGLFSEKDEFTREAILFGRQYVSQQQRFERFLTVNSPFPSEAVRSRVWGRHEDNINENIVFLEMYRMLYQDVPDEDVDEQSAKVENVFGLAALSSIYRSLDAQKKTAAQYKFEDEYEEYKWLREFELAGELFIHLNGVPYADIVTGSNPNITLEDYLKFAHAAFRLHNQRLDVTNPIHISDPMNNVFPQMRDQKVNQITSTSISLFDVRPEDLVGHVLPNGDSVPRHIQQEAASMVKRVEKVKRRMRTALVTPNSRDFKTLKSAYTANISEDPFVNGYLIYLVGPETVWDLTQQYQKIDGHIKSGIEVDFYTRVKEDIEVYIHDIFSTSGWMNHDEIQNYVNESADNDGKPTRPDTCSALKRIIQRQSRGLHVTLGVEEDEFSQLKQQPENVEFHIASNPHLPSEVIFNFKSPDDELKRLVLLVTPGKNSISWHLPKNIDDYSEYRQSLEEIVSQLLEDLHAQMYPSTDAQSVIPTQNDEQLVNTASSEKRPGRKRKHNGHTKSEEKTSESEEQEQKNGGRTVHMRDGVVYKIRKPSRQFKRKKLKNVSSDFVDRLDAAIEGFNSGELKGLTSMTNLGQDIYEIRFGDGRAILKVISTTQGKMDFEVIEAADREHISEKMGGRRPRRG